MKLNNKSSNPTSNASWQTYTKDEVDSVCTGISSNATLKVKSINSEADLTNLNLCDGEIAIATDGTIYTTVSGNSSCIGSVSSSDLASSTSVSTSGSLNWTAATPTISWGTANNSYAYGGITGSIDYYDTMHYNNQKSQYFDAIIDYLDEEDLLKIFKTLEERGEENITSIINSIIQKRHFSEDFLLEFSDRLDMKVVKQYYSSDIKSQKYPRIALLVQV